MEKVIDFYKMSGSGNDFILIDNRATIIEPEVAPELARDLCRRKISVGADGLILIENDDEVDFSWNFFNADGSRAEMCGNGGRCVARLANMLGICGSSLSFRTLAGIIRAEVSGSRVKLQMTEPRDLKLDMELELNGQRFNTHFVNTGVPHTVFILDGPEVLEQQEVVKQGRKVRFHSQFAPAGTNVNFVAVLNEQALALRTYERGVEDETLACGTGATAVALVGAAKGMVKPPVAVRTKSGETLVIYFDPKKELPQEVYMEGETTVIYQGRLWEEAVHIPL
ncbi:MAG: diaminopimelate epimerase [Deltaproteobacteria bacterium]|nr:MAG: diaminopimelate epimerase [Deltaproteobacteria bacterium]